MKLLQSNGVAPTIRRKSKSDGFTQILRETCESYASENLNPVINFLEFYGNPAMFSEYVEKISVGMDADDAEQFAQLVENGRITTVSESLVSQIMPIAGLSMPIVRKLWTRCVMKDVFPTETAKFPAFKIEWLEPYVLKADGTKIVLPEGLIRDAISNNDILEKPRLKDEYIPLPNNTYNLMTAAGGSVALRDAIDLRLSVVNVKMDVSDAKDGSEVVEIKTAITLSHERTINGTITYVNKAGNKISDTLFGSVNCENGELNAVSVQNRITAIKFKGWLTQENNLRQDNVSFDVKHKDVTIGTGGHISAPLPIEFLTDTMALHNIDAAVESVDIMSQIVGQKLDHELYAFLVTSFDNSASQMNGRFDCRPPAGFAGSPTEWRKELRTTIDWWAQKLVQSVNNPDGTFVIVGNTLDIGLIPDVEWTFKSTEGERAGVRVDYNFGVATNNATYKFVSSNNISQGFIRMIFIPSNDNFMTYKYYPYTFHIQRDYINSTMSNVPNIMMTKRHIIEELIPVQATIAILNNDGDQSATYRL